MEDCINCPRGETDCPWLTEVRRNFLRAVNDMDPYRGPTMKDDYGRPLPSEFTAIQSVGLPGMRGKRKGGIE